MGEILFRGKCLFDKSFVEGFLFKTNEHTYIAYAEQYDDDLFFSPKNIFIEIDPETVGQYTGKPDKNGTKIFEGDIVAFYFFDNGVKNTRTMLIEWIDSGFCMKELFRDYRLSKDFNIITEKIYSYKGEIKQGIYKSNNSYFVEVIGNIHDNPELLKGE